MVRLFGYIGFASFLLITSLSCDSSEPLINNGNKLTLVVEDSSSTELRLKLTSANIPLPISLSLNQDNYVIQTIDLCCNDTLLYIDSLLPKQTYKFKAEATNYQPPASNELTAQTMDTTSHNFTWQSFTFGGDCGSSVLYDVAIIDENNIWAVGEIYVRDSLGNCDPTFYNAVHWNGQTWELKKIGGIGGWACHTVFAFSTNDIWFEGNIHWDGTNYTVHKNGWPLMPNGDGWQVNKIWGISNNDLYAVGNNGNIARYKNGSWTKIESGTNSNINDIWGFINKAGEVTAYCPVSSFFVNGDKKIIKIVDGMVDSVNWGRDIRLYSIWAETENILYSCGEGVHEYKFEKWKDILLPPIDFNSLRGNEVNDIFIAGDLGLLFHFNGWGWQTLSIINYDKGYSEISVIKNMFAVCGYHYNKALLEIGRRY